MYDDSRAYHENLTRIIIEHSYASDWARAVLEWKVIDCFDDRSFQAACICGKERLRYLFTIRNTRSEKELYPIGSVCIGRFGRSDLNAEVATQEGLFKLLQAFEENRYITLTSDFFSRRLLKYLLEAGAFSPTKYNRGHPERDYQFLLDLFNKRNKQEITAREQRHINALMVTSVKPYLATILKGKVLP